MLKSLAEGLRSCFDLFESFAEVPVDRFFLLESLLRTFGTKFPLPEDL